MVLELPVDDNEYDVSLSPWWEVMLLENKEILTEEENMGRWEDVVDTLERKGILDNRRQVWQEAGMQTSKIETARNMKAEGLDLHLISRITGLTFDEVLNV